MRESRSSGSVEGVGGNLDPYSDPRVQAQEFETAVGMRVELAAATASSIEHGIRRHYYGETRTPQKMARVALKKTLRPPPKPAPPPAPLDEPPEAQIEEDLPEAERAPAQDEQALPSLEPECCRSRAQDAQSSTRSPSGWPGWRCS